MDQPKAVSSSWSLGFRIEGLGFLDLGFLGLGFIIVQGLGSRAWASGVKAV